MDEFWVIKKTIRRTYRTTIEAGECIDSMEFEIATDAMTKTQFFENIRFILKHMNDILGEKYKLIMHSIHLMPKGQPNQSCTVWCSSTCEIISDRTLFFITFLLFNKYFSP